MNKYRIHKLAKTVCALWMVPRVTVLRQADVT